MHDLVAETEAELQVLALHRGTIADALDLEGFGKSAFVTPSTRFGNPGARHAPHRAWACFDSSIRLDDDAVRRLLDGAVFGHRER